MTDFVPAFPFDLSNGTIADANQVMADLNLTRDYLNTLAADVILGSLPVIGGHTLAEWFAGVGKTNDNPAQVAFFGQDGAVFQRFIDRVFIGGAVENDGDYPNVRQDWLSTFQVGKGLSVGAIVSAQAAILTENFGSAGSALVVGSQSLYATSVGFDAIGFESYALLNNTTYANNGYSIYGEVHRIASGAGQGVFVEGDVVAWIAGQTPTPYTQGLTVWGQIAAGAGLSSTGQFDADVGLQWAANPMPFKLGMSFLHGSLVTDGGGVARAIAFDVGMNQEWFNSSEQAVAEILATNTDASKLTGIDFTSNGLQIFGAGALPIAYFFPTVANATNYFYFSNAATGNPPNMGVGGSDTDIDFWLRTQGAGVMRFGTHAAKAAEAFSGYIEIKDNNGTLRKLMVCS